MELSCLLNDMTGVPSCLSLTLLLCPPGGSLNYFYAAAGTLPVLFVLSMLLRLKLKL